MPNLRRRVVYVAIAALFVGVSPAQDKPDTPKKPTVMQRKLLHAQKILEGLAKEDFEKIGTNSDGLMDCIRDAKWRVHGTDKYLMFSDDFRQNVEGLQKAAKEKKIDAATLAYMSMTMSCVKCHRYLRDEGLALGEFLPASGAEVAAGRP